MRKTPEQETIPDPLTEEEIVRLRNCTLDKAFKASDVQGRDDFLDYLKTNGGYNPDGELIVEGFIDEHGDKKIGVFKPN